MRRMPDARGRALNSWESWCEKVRGRLDTPRPLAQAGEHPDLRVMDILSKKTGWKDVVLVCRKCSKKLDGGGFGPHGDKTLKKALRKYFKSTGGAEAELAVRHTGCFDICPKDAVVAINASNPKALLIVPAGADLFEVKARLGLKDERRRAPEATAATEG